MQRVEILQRCQNRIVNAPWYVINDLNVPYVRDEIKRNILATNLMKDVKTTRRLKSIVTL